MKSCSTCAYRSICAKPKYYRQKLSKGFDISKYILYKLFAENCDLYKEYTFKDPNQMGLRL